MPVKVIQHSKSPSNYHDNNSIIMQLVLFEMIQAFKSIKTIEQTLQNLEKVPKRKPVHFTRILDAITLLSGRSEKTSRIFTWNLNDGLLGKIKDYCSFFANNSNKKIRDTDSLHRQADIVWLHGLECLDVIHIQKKPDLEEIKTSIHSLHKKLLRFSKILVTTLMHFKKDENVLFFLLEQKNEIEAIYGIGFVYKLFRKMFPKGLQHAETFLINQYSERGFTKLGDKISKHLLEIDPANQ